MTDEERDLLLSQTPDLPLDFSEWVMDLFENDHTFFFSRPDRDIVVECCHCGAISRWTTKKSDLILPPWGDKEPPKKYDDAFCPFCEAGGKMMPRKNRKNPIRTETDVWIGQHMEDGGAGGYMLRFFRPILLAWPDDENSDEKLVLGERMRVFFPVGMRKKSYKLFWHSWGSNEEWNTSYGFSTMGFYYDAPTPGTIYPNTFEEMQGTIMQYSCTEEALDLIGYNKTIAEWQQAYIKNRWLEAFFKMGLYGLMNQIMYGWSWPRCNYRAKNPYDYLKISKSRLKDLCDIDDKLQMKALAIFRVEKKLGENFGPGLLEVIKIGISEEDFELFLEYMTVTKLLNYLNKQKCNLFRNTDLNATYLKYRDYLNMKKKVGCDMTDDITLFPKDLEEAHAKAVLESDQKEADKRKKEAEERFARIKTRFKSADKVYHYEKGSLIIRPAKSASEIVDEGRILHHCVGGDGYLRAHADRKSIICFIRYKKKPDIPYITVEIKPDCTIEQWYGVNDSKPDEKKIDRWLKNYMKSRDPQKIKRESKRPVRQAV